MGHTYKVRLVKKVDKENSCGEVVYTTKTVRLKKANKDYNEDMVIETFFHELIHAILDEAEYNNLSDDERLVERMSRLMHQAFKTFRYDNNNDRKQKHTTKS